MGTDILQELLYKEQFFYTDCIVIGKSCIFCYNIINKQPKIDKSILVDKDNLTNIFQNFSINISGSTYVGGEASSHGSCGFFYKKTGCILNWALMSLDSNPFISVEEIIDGVIFVSSVGHRWVVRGDDIENVQIIWNCGSYDDCGDTRNNP